MGFGENIKLRREALGISLRELADNIGVSHTTVSKYEKDLLTPNSKTLISLSKALKVSLPTLIRPRNPAITIDSCAFRSRKISKKKETQINAETAEWLERYLQIETLSNTKHEFLIPEGFPITISSIEDTENVAKSLRKKWDLGTDPIDNLTSVLEDKGIKIGLIEGIDNFDALFTFFENKPLIVVKKGITKVRQRFSIAHELGHCLVNVPDGIDPESVMNRFAGAFLVPDEVVFFELGKNRSRLSVNELLILKDKYGISMAAWLHRAKDLKIIKDEEYTRLFKVFSYNGWRTKEPHDDTPIEKPIFMTGLVFKCHAEGLISTSKAAELLSMSIGAFCSINGESDLECASTICD